MSGVQVIICVCVLVGLLAVTGAYLYGRKAASKQVHDALAAKIDQYKKNAILMRDAKGKAEQANLAKSAFLANMSHELRTPLNGILGLTDILKSDDLTHSQYRKINLIHGSGETLLRLLSDILDISKIEAGSIELEEIDVDLQELMRKAYDFWHPIARAKNIDLVFKKQKSMPEYVVSDPTRIRQCLDNIINNALKFTPEEGRISVKGTAALANGRFLIGFAVQDNGMGIRSDDLAKLFKPFTQAEAKTTRKFGGTGLGLAITKNLCEAMGGQVQVRSELGVGTIFKMSFLVEHSTELSRRETLTKNLSPATPMPTDLTGLRCLVVEDNAVNTEVLRLLLEPCELIIQETTNGQEALKALETQYFDIVLMDLQMPIMGGLEAVKIIRGTDKTYSQIPIIAMTANAMEEDQKTCLEVGFNEFLAKPLQRSSLIAAMGRALNSHPQSKQYVA